MKWNEVIPIIISILVILIVAFLQKESKLMAAVTATMPMNIPLSLWIVYSATQGDKKQVPQFTQGLVIGIVPTVAFTIAIWLASRAGLKLAPILFAGYATWLVVLAILLSVRKAIGL